MGQVSQGNRWIMTINLAFQLIQLIFNKHTNTQRHTDGGWQNIEIWGVGVSTEREPK